MHNELNRVTKKPVYQEMDFDNEPWDKQSIEWWRYNNLRDDSSLLDLFQGQLMNKTECLKCGYSSIAFDNYMDLSLSFPKKSRCSLEDCLTSFISEERMQECGYRCSKCKRKDNFSKQMTIWKLPKILVIHLKRFSNTNRYR